MNEKVAIIGLGYVGLPVALAFARAFPGTVGFDIDERKVRDLRNNIDRTREVSTEDLEASTIQFTTDPADLTDATFFVVAVPTPIDQNRKPDLQPLISASETIGRVIRPGAVVVFESTVYPGMTEETCGPVIARVSGLEQGVDFKLGYSPERINPGDKERTLEKIVKVVSGQDEQTLERVARMYAAIVPAGIHRAPSIKVAEAAKVIENTQRDLNISLMNELAIIFERLGINTTDVLEAAGTKWNFLPFRPGLVGGHCIGVDPYYLTTKAEEVGYHPQVILAGRRINDGMGAFVARKLVMMLSQRGVTLRDARVAILGLTFKENVPDLRNSRVPDIIKELGNYGIAPLVHDPFVDPDEARREYGLELTPWEELGRCDGMVLAVAHDGFRERVCDELPQLLREGGAIADVKGVLRGAGLPAAVEYWSL